MPQFNNAELVNNLAPYFIRPGETIDSLAINKQVIAGDGLIGGGLLTQDVTLNVGEGDGVNVLSDSVELQPPGTITTQSENLAYSTGHTHVWNTVPVQSYHTSLGTINKKYLQIHAAELWVDTLVAQETIATIGGRILVGPTTELASDLEASATTMWVKHNQITANATTGDVIYMEKDGQVEFMRATAGPSTDSDFLFGATYIDGDGSHQVFLETQNMSRKQAYIYGDYASASSKQAYIAGPGSDVSDSQQAYMYGSPGAADIVLNGDFESWSSSTDADNWTESGTVNRDSTFVHGGTYSARLSQSLSSQLTQNISVEPNRTYNLAIWSYYQSGNGPPRYGIYDVTNSGYLIPINSAASGADSWQEETNSFTTASNTATIRVEILAPTTAGYIARVDDFSIYATVVKSRQQAFIEGDYHYFSVYPVPGGGIGSTGFVAGPSANTLIQWDPQTVLPNTTYEMQYWTRGDGYHQLRYAVYDYSNKEYIIPLTKSGVPGEDYVQKSIFFITPPTCTEVVVEHWCPEEEGGWALLWNPTLWQYGYSYTVTRDLDGSGSNDWYTGDAVFNTGTTGDGFIDLYSIQGVNNGSSNGPTIVGNVRTGTAYNNWIEHWAIGNLKGLYGQASDVYGVGIGRYGASYNHILITDSNGLEFYNGTTVTSDRVGHWATSGDFTLGRVGADKGNVFWDESEQQFNFRENTTTHFRFDMNWGGNSRRGFIMGENVDSDDAIGFIVNVGTSGAGASTVTQTASKGLVVINAGGNNFTLNGETIGDGDILIGTNYGTNANVLWDRTAGQLQFRGGTNIEAYIDTDGTITAGNANIRIGKTGIQLKDDYPYIDDNTLSWRTAFGTGFGIFNITGGIQVEEGPVYTHFGYMWLQPSASEVCAVELRWDDDISYATLNIRSNNLIRLASSGTIQISGSTGGVVLDSSGAAAGIRFNDHLYVEANEGLYVGATSGATDNDIRATGDIVAGHGLYAGSATGEPPNTGDIIATNDIRCDGGLYVGSSTAFNPAADNIYADGKIFVNETANSFQTNGITINQATGGSSNQAIALREDGVNHGMTSDAGETSTWFLVRELADNLGGAVMQAFNESIRGLVVAGYGVSEDTGTTNAATAALEIRGGKRSGAGPSVTTLGTTGNVLAIQNNGTAIVLFKGDGTVYAADTSWASSFTDDYDDIKLLTSARTLLLSDPEHELKRRHREWIKYSRPVLEEMKIMAFNDEDGTAMVSVQGLQMLTIDTLRQMYSKMERMEQALLNAGIPVPELEA